MSPLWAGWAQRLVGSAASREHAPAANWRSQEWILQERTRRQQQQQLCLGRVPVLQAWDSLLWTVAWSKQASLQASRPYEEDGGDSAQQATSLCVCVEGGPGTDTRARSRAPPATPARPAAGTLPGEREAEPCKLQSSTAGLRLVRGSVSGVAALGPRFWPGASVPQCQGGEWGRQAKGGHR